MIVSISRCPSFYDEVKLLLPANLKQNHHLLFTIFHISCQKKPQEAQAPMETPVGYTVSGGRVRVAMAKGGVSGKVKFTH